MIGRLRAFWSGWLCWWCSIPMQLRSPCSLPRGYANLLRHGPWLILSEGLSIPLSNARSEPDSMANLPDSSLTPQPCMPWILEKNWNHRKPTFNIEIIIYPHDLIISIYYYEQIFLVQDHFSPPLHVWHGFLSTYQPTNLCVFFFNGNPMDFLRSPASYRCAQQLEAKAGFKYFFLNWGNDPIWHVNRWT